MFNIKNFGTEKWGQKNGDRPQFYVKRGYQITSFLGYMYEYFTFAPNLSFIEDRVKSNNSGISLKFSLAHLLHLN